MKPKKTLQYIGYAIFILVGIFLFFIDIDFKKNSVDSGIQNYVKGEVISTKNEQEKQSLEISLKNGKKILLINDYTLFTNERKYSIGDKLILDEYEGNYFIVDYIRSPILIILFGVFLLILLAVNKGKGISSLLSMGFSFLVLFKLVLPLLLTGMDPVFTTLFGMVFILPAIFYLSHGFNKKTNVAMAGTLFALIMTGLLAALFTELTHLSGLASEEAGFLKSGMGENIHFKGLLLAGMIIGILGILDDITITQTSVVEQLKEGNKNITFNELFLRSMSVGTDHIASVVNTLVLVYTGASLPLLLLFINASQSIGQLINLEFMAEEIVRTLIGSIGLILAVPITSLIASMVYKAESS